MSDNIVSIDKIRADAQRAARDNRSPTVACMYPLGSPASRLWMLEYTKQINRMAMLARARGAQGIDDMGGDAA